MQQQIQKNLDFGQQQIYPTKLQCIKYNPITNNPVQLNSESVQLFKINMNMGVDFQKSYFQLRIVHDQNVMYLPYKSFIKKIRIYSNEQDNIFTEDFDITPVIKSQFLNSGKSYISQYEQQFDELQINQQQNDRQNTWLKFNLSNLNIFSQKMICNPQGPLFIQITLRPSNEYLDVVTSIQTPQLVIYQNYDTEINNLLLKQLQSVELPYQYNFSKQFILQGGLNNTHTFKQIQSNIPIQNGKIIQYITLSLFSNQAGNQMITNQISGISLELDGQIIHIDDNPQLNYLSNQQNFVTDGNKIIVIPFFHQFDQFDNVGNGIKYEDNQSMKNLKIDVKTLNTNGVVQTLQVNVITQKYLKIIDNQLRSMI